MRRSGHRQALRIVPGTVLLGCLLLAGAAFGQDDTEAPVVLPADSTGAGAAVEPAAAAAADSLLELPEIAQPEPADLWETGASPVGAVLMTPLFPGWGQLYTDGSWRAALAYGSQMWFWSRMLLRDRQAVRARHFAHSFEADSVNYKYYDALAEENWQSMRDFAWWSGASLLIIALDSYVGANLFHFDDDPVPVPNRWDEIFDPAAEQAPGLTDQLSVVVFQFGRRF